MTRRIALLLVAFILNTALALPLLVAQKPPRTDDVIFDEVRQKLANDAEVRGNDFNITIKSGAVTIKGFVHTEKAKEKATTLAKKVKGVTSVDNQLKLFTDKS